MIEPNIYSHLDIERYLRKEMSSKQMHDFEKALLNDPFLADAFDGYATGDFELAKEHLAEIKNEITDQKNDSKVIGLPATKRSWWKVAAIFLIIVSGVFSYFAFKNNTAKTEIAKAAVDKPSEGSAQNDTIKPAETPIANAGVLQQTGPFKNNNPVTPPIIQNNPNAPLASLDHKGRPHTSLQPEEITEGKYAGSAPALGYVDVAIDKTARDRSVFDSDSLQRQAESANKAEKLIPAMDLKDNKGLVKADEVKKSLINNDDSPLVVNTTSAALAKAKARKNTALTIFSKDQPAAVTASTGAMPLTKAQPVGGWKKFYEYILNKVDSLHALGLIKSEHFTVTVEFLINENGRPYNISAGGGAKSESEQAANIIKTGPLWIGKKDEKVQVSVPF